MNEVTKQAFHASTRRAMVDHYMLSSGLAPVAVLCGGDIATRFIWSSRPFVDGEITASQVSVSALFWTRFGMSAQIVVATAYALLDAGDFGATPGPGGVTWRKFPPARGGDVIAGAARHCGVTLMSDHDARLRADEAIDGIDADFDARRRSGELRSINRAYHDRRLAADEPRTWGGYVLDLKRKAAATHAAKHAPAWFD